MTTENAMTAPLIEWSRHNLRELPWRRDDAGPWGVLVSEFMLQQTPVARVLPRYLSWMDRWPDPAALAAASDADVLRAWANLGYPRRALWLRRAAEQLVASHDGAVPEVLDALLALQGVGDYTARAVLAFGFGRRVPVVDTNVRRVIARAVRGDGDAPVDMRRDLAETEALLPHSPQRAAQLSAALMELGALICTARAPRCDECPLAGQCRWRGAGYPEYEGRRRIPQKAYEGSDRQARGRVLATLREAEVPVVSEALHVLWHDKAQLQRALDSLARDGLIVPVDDHCWQLPGAIS